MADRYWVGGAGTWDLNVGTKWATTSGGAGGASIPTSTDNVFFDANSGSGTVLVNVSTCANLNFTGFTGSIGATTNGSLECHGNLTLGSTMGNFGDGQGSFIFAGSGSYTLRSNGILSRWSGTSGGLVVRFSASVTLLDDLQVQKMQLGGSTFSVNCGLFLNNFTLDLGFGTGILIVAEATDGPTLDFGETGKILVRTGGTQINIQTLTTEKDITFTGSKHVSVAIESSSVILDQANYAGFNSIQHGLNYISTADNQATFRYRVAGDIDWRLGTGGISSRSSQDFISGNFYWGDKTVAKASTNSDTVFNANSGTKTISGTGFWEGSMTINPQGTATYNLGSNITQNNNTRYIFSYNGVSGTTFNTNNFNITTSGFSSSGGTSNLGTSTISSYGNNFGFPTPYLVIFGSGTDASNATVRAIGLSSRVVASNVTIGTLELATTSTITIPTTTTNFTINTLSNTVFPAAITFPSGITTTVNNFNISGTAGNLVTVRSTTAGSRAFINKASGTVNVNYLDIRDSRATGGATWNALLTNGNVNSGNNVGWIFDDTEFGDTGTTGNMFMMFH